MLKHKTIYLVLATVALSAFSAGCLQAPYRRTYDYSNGIKLPGPYGSENGGAAYNSAGIRPEDSNPQTLPSAPQPKPEVVGTQPILSFPIEKLGYTKHEITVSTRTVLKVRFTPGEQTRSAEGHPETMPNYAHLMVYVKVGSAEKNTGLLSSGMDYDAETSHELDFSKSFSKTCASTDESCRQNVTITVYKPNYDYYCRNYPASYNCYATPGWSRVYDKHWWNGVLEVRTDDTVAFE